ncbi:MAG: MarR family winged helix-turn-helix transcriptional regulator [Pseudomonadota bacterium]
MNNKATPINDDFLSYQTARLKGLIQEIIGCCEDRKIFESQKFGLPYAELKCMMLFPGERYLTVKNIAQNLEVAKSRVTKLINGLTEKGFVEVIDDPKDARVKLISLTAAGRRKAEEIDAFQGDIHRKILVQLDGEERNNLLSRLEILRTAMEAVKSQLV